MTKAKLINLLLLAAMLASLLGKGHFLGGSNGGQFF
jgi:hypothetical protein